MRLIGLSQRTTLSALSSQLSALSSQLSALSSQLSALSSQLSALSSQLPAPSSQLPAPSKGVAPSQWPPPHPLMPDGTGIEFPRPPSRLLLRGFPKRSDSSASSIILSHWRSFRKQSRTKYPSYVLKSISVEHLIRKVVRLQSLKSNPFRGILDFQIFVKISSKLHHDRRP